MIAKFKVAFEGLKEALKDRSVIIQCILGIMAIIAGLILKLTYGEWLFFIICIGLVIAFEIINTAIEKLCDLISEEYDQRIKRIKDMSSAAVLIVALTALLIAFIIFIQHLKGWIL